MEQLTSLLLLLFSSHIPLPLTDNLSALPATEVRGSENHSPSILFAQSLDVAALQDSLSRLYEEIELDKQGLAIEVFKYAMTGYLGLLQQGKLSDKKLISIIDFTKSSNTKRFYTIDLEKRTLKYHTYVSHGKNSGEEMAKSFSNTVHSNQSSLGFYITAETYVGSKGYSLKLDGVEKGYNDKLRERAVVMHNAEYVSEYWIKKYGRLGRSQGCPALPQALGKEVINAIKNHTAVFAYYDDPAYLNASRYLRMENVLTPLASASK